jgi:uncharacterized protein (DUF433 family)
MKTIVEIEWDDKNYPLTLKDIRHALRMYQEDAKIIARAPKKIL